MDEQSLQSIKEDAAFAFLRSVVPQGGDLDSEGEAETATAENGEMKLSVKDSRELGFMSVTVTLFRKDFPVGWKIFRAVEEQQQLHHLEMVSCSSFSSHDSCVYSFMLKHTHKGLKQLKLNAKEVTQKLIEATGIPDSCY